MTKIPRQLTHSTNDLLPSLQMVDGLESSPDLGNSAAVLARKMTDEIFAEFDMVCA